MGIFNLFANGTDGKGVVWNGKWKCGDHKDYGRRDVSMERVSYYSNTSEC
jgi:hypothetical protein